ncbi:MAG TPA: STAS domain-containing protein [Rhodocyclaceae bacterium]|nr:STAS domain-containing protein [Rhodocyclaceae bacterium]
MIIETTSRENTARMSMAGELTIYTVAASKAKLAAVMNNASDIEIDLSGVTEMDTAGLQWMLIAKRHPGKRLRFVNHPPAVLRLLDLANLGGVLGDPLIISATEH